MLTTADLISGLLGYLAMGVSIQMFVPEYIGFFKAHVGKIDGKPKPPATSDFALLLSLVVVGKFIITQLALYIILAVIETVFLTLLLIWAGYCCCMRHHRAINRRAVIKQDQSRSAVRAGLLAMQSGGIHKLPPGTHDVHGAYNDQARQNKMVRDGEARAKRRNSWKWLGIQLAIVLVIFSAIWAGVDYARRNTAEPPPISERPESTGEVIAWGVAWFGLACWLAPRGINISRSLYYKRPESITTDAVLIGSLSHFFNIGSILTLNNKGDALYAQLPFVCTSISCVSTDIFRLTLKFIFRKGQTLPPWTSFFGLFSNGEQYDPFYKPEEQKRRKRDMLKPRRKNRSPPASSSDLEHGGHSSSSDGGHSHSGSNNEKEPLTEHQQHVKYLRQAALLPFVPVPKPPSDDDDSDDHFHQHRRLAQASNRNFIDKYNEPRDKLAALHRDHNLDTATQLDRERRLAAHARAPYNPEEDGGLRQEHHDAFRGAADERNAQRLLRENHRRRDGLRIVNDADPADQGDLAHFDNRHYTSSENEARESELHRRQNDPTRRLPLDHIHREATRRLSSDSEPDLGFTVPRPADKERAKRQQWLREHSAAQEERLKRERGEADKKEEEKQRRWWRKGSAGGGNTSSGEDSGRSA
ncbi:hypothetical protein JCM6882_001904 [Rhodosporidiobolus microsporus]